MVPRVTHAETMEPQYQMAWKRFVTFARCRGCAISVVRGGAAVCAKARPTPSINLVPKNAQGPFVAHWTMAVASMREDPSPIVKRLPNRSLTNEAGMKAGRPPKLMPARISPRMAELMFPRLLLTGRSGHFGAGQWKGVAVVHWLMASRPLMRLPS